MCCKYTTYNELTAHNVMNNVMNNVKHETNLVT
jgi:hypothetical protein